VRLFLSAGLLAHDIYSANSRDSTVSNYHLKRLPCQIFLAGAVYESLKPSLQERNECLELEIRNIIPTPYSAQKSPLPLFSKEGLELTGEDSPFEKGGQRGI